MFLIFVYFIFSSTFVSSNGSSGDSSGYSSVTSSFAGWIDPDSPPEVRTTLSYYDGKEYELIMSDEFNRDGRTFADGDDPMWTAIEKSDDAITSSDDISLEYYNSSYATTRNGSLVIKTDTLDTRWRGWDPYKKKYIEMKRNFRSAMLQSWNKFCFTGGIFEISIKFPGESSIGGLWPAVWLLGNLGRATYEASTNLVWPWSYPVCDRKLQHAQSISGCDITTHYDLNARQGRGATEIDIIEVMAGPPGPLPIIPEFSRPYVSMTLQVFHISADHDISFDVFA
jgi:beta-glucanase (GH16 family)